MSVESDAQTKLLVLTPILSSSTVNRDLLIEKLEHIALVNPSLFDLIHEKCTTGQNGSSVEVAGMVRAAIQTLNHYQSTDPEYWQEKASHIIDMKLRSSVLKAWHLHEAIYECRDIMQDSNGAYSITLNDVDQVVSCAIRESSVPTLDNDSEACWRGTSMLAVLLVNLNNTKPRDPDGQLGKFIDWAGTSDDPVSIVKAGIQRGTFNTDALKEVLDGYAPLSIGIL